MSISRRVFLSASAAASAGIVVGAENAANPDLHREILELAQRQRRERMERFAAVESPGQLKALQQDLRQRFLDLVDGWPEQGGGPAKRVTGKLLGDGYTVEKLAFESLPGYWVTTLLYQPTGHRSPRPAIISPCGHAAVGKASPTYQTLHINLAKRGFVVLTYDPVGQGERSQFWNAAEGRSRYNRVCGEHSVLGNPLYLLGTSLAKYRIWDGMRAIDLLTSMEDVDAQRIGCIGNSGGGTLTAYISALDERVRVPVIGCYITSLPHRMENRVEADPDSDPEQDIFGFVQQGIDHAGLLAMMVPRPTLICAAQQDFFPIEGTRQTLVEAQRLYQVAGAKNRIKLVEADARHGLSLKLREAAYGWFQHWLAGQASSQPEEEFAVTPRPAGELQVCGEGQANIDFNSRHFLTLALNEFQRQHTGNRSTRDDLKTLLRLDPDSAKFRLTELAPLRHTRQDLFLLVNGFNAMEWIQHEEFTLSLKARGAAASIIDARGIGSLRIKKTVAGRGYADPLAGVEANLAYNAFLTGRSLVGMRVADVLAALAELTAQIQPRRIVICGCLDAGLISALVAAVEPRIECAAIEETSLSFLPLFKPAGRAINAAELIPGLLRDFGDFAEVLAQIAPRQVLASACPDRSTKELPAVQVSDQKFSQQPELLHAWLGTA